MVIAAFWEVLVGRVFFWGDFSALYVPMRRILVDAHSWGSLLWTDSIANGRVFLANPISGVLYPPSYLVHLGAPERVLTGLTLVHTILGASGVMLVARRWNLSRSASWMAGTVFAFTGVSVSLSSYPILQYPVAWTPWLLLFADRLAEESRLRDRVGLSIAGICILVTGEPITIVSASVGVVFLMIERGRLCGVAWRPFFQRIAIPLAVAIAIATPLIVATFNYLPQTQRGVGFDPSYVMHLSLHPAQLLEFLVPHPFGDPTRLGDARFAAAALVQPKDFPLFQGMYVGCLGLTLMLAGAIATIRLKRPVLLLWLACGLLLALGRFGPIYPWLAELSFASAVRFPVKWICAGLAPTALLVGFGLDELRSRRCLGSLALATPALLVLIGIAGALHLGVNEWIAGLDLGSSSSAVESVTQAGDRLVGAAWRSAVPLLAGMAIWVWGRRSRRESTACWLLAGALTCDLVLENRTRAPMVDSEFYQKVPRIAEAILEDERDSVGGRIWVEPVGGRTMNFREPLRSASELQRWYRDGLQTLSSIDYGLKLSLSGDIDEADPSRYQTLGHFVDSAPRRERLMLLGSAGVSHLVTFSEWSSPHLELIGQFQDPNLEPIRLYRNLLVQPRVRVVKRLVVYDGPRDFASVLRQSSEDAFNDTAFVDESQRPTEMVSVSEGGQAWLVSDEGSRLVIRVKGFGGYLVVSDTLIDGWQAEVDGVETPIIPVDIAFRAVALPPGEHEVVMTYSPWR